ncbi:MAG: RHS repeat-associated core domain-containing protein, partial [Prevotellaceae bacterium]|nr:RHS repeat-associated core domain-containing protein [Prevotellaceae bacterium]
MQVFRTTYNHSNNPYAVSRLSSGEELLWDNAGNLCHREDKSRHQHFYWTEDNRMQAYYSQQDAVNTVAYYRYDASGERDLKLLGVVESVKIQAVDYRIPILKPKPGKEYSDAVLYASPLMTVNSTGYTKHYFAESERILSNVAGGRSRPLVPVDLELKSITGEEPAELAANFMVFVGDYLKQASGGTCSPSDINYIAHIQKFPPLATIFADRVAADYRDERYFYHSDHLSGASMITNVGGGLHQTLAYCPYGEPLVDIKNGNYDERYQFTGYEKDGESGLNYAHSRYDWDYGGIFISTDPMWFKYPNLTSYAYCGNNPISYIDPDGRDAILIVFPDYLVDPDLHIKRTIP